MLSTRTSFFVYIVSSPSRTIYIGVTNGLRRRVGEHKMKDIRGFTATYHVDRLVGSRSSRIQPQQFHARSSSRVGDARTRLEQPEIRVTRRSSRKKPGSLRFGRDDR